MLNISKLLKVAGIATGTLGTTWLIAGWCDYCQQQHHGNRCPAQTIGAVNHPYECDDYAYNRGYGCDAYYRGRRQGYNEAYRSFNCLQWFNERDREGWDSDDEEEYVRQAEERARELRRRRTHHHAQTARRRQQAIEQAIDIIWRIKSQEDLLAILNALQNRVQDLGLGERQIVRPGFNPCAGYDPYACNEMNHYGYNYGCVYGCNR